MLTEILFTILSFNVVIYFKILNLPIIRIIRNLLYSVRSKPIVKTEIVDNGPWKHAWLQANGLEFHYVSSGNVKNPLMLLLHGFPESWYSWRHIIPEFSNNYRVVAIDLRGYNLSSKPKNLSDYTMTELTQDIEHIIKSLGYEKAILVGHDWGGAIAWSFASRYPSMVSRLIILCCPHPSIFPRHLRSNINQLKRSWYIFFFQIALLPEYILRRNNYYYIRQAFAKKNLQYFNGDDIAEFVKSAAQPGAMTAMLNFYRNSFHSGFSKVLKILKGQKIETPTLVLFAENDDFLGTEMLNGTERYVNDLTRKIIPNASHWLQQDQPKVVARNIHEFLAKYPLRE
jgi:pimeloyl-ACP methyl ester carboxylesterase